MAGLDTSKEEVKRSRKTGKKTYYTDFDLSVEQYSKQYLIMSSNVSEKKYEKNIIDTVQRTIVFLSEKEQVEAFL